MITIKTDFHLHTSGDRHDAIGYSEKELIMHAAKEGFKALAITNHDTFTFSHSLRRFAADLGVLLIPGIERKVEGKHVLLLNANRVSEKIRTFEEVRAAKDDGAFVIAPHPFFKAATCLEGKLLEHLELFDALEFSFFYSRFFNLNRRAVKLAKEKGLPLVGNSDCHVLKYFALCHSTIQTEDLTMKAVFAAIKANRVKVCTQPIFLPRLAAILADMKLQHFRIALARAQAREEQGQSAPVPQPTIRSKVSPQT